MKVYTYLMPFNLGVHPLWFSFIATRRTVYLDNFEYVFLQP